MKHPVGNLDQVRWERLWWDLAAQADQLERDDFDAEVADRARREHADVSLLDRVRASLGQRLTCQLADGTSVRGVLVGYGADWLALDAAPATPGESAALVPMAALRAVVGLASAAVPDQAVGAVTRRRDLRMVLAGLGQARTPVRIRRSGAADLRGEIVRVGSDYLDLRSEDGTTWSLPLAGCLAVTPPVTPPITPPIT